MYHVAHTVAIHVYVVVGILLATLSLHNLCYMLQMHIKETSQFNSFTLFRRESLVQGSIKQCLHMQTILSIG